MFSQFEPAISEIWRRSCRSLKRAIDVLGSAFVLLTLAPFMGALALWVKRDSPGPAIYSQERVGRSGRVFKIYKFRSMVVDAEAQGPRWCSGRDDPRTTRVGAFLRRTHLDELPQLWNVLKGEMSLVGPRPERPCFVQELQVSVPGYDERHLVRPGLTGLAQVHYRYDASITDVKRKLRFDRLYVERMCLALDVRILWWTAAFLASWNTKEPQVHPQANGAALKLRTGTG